MKILTPTIGKILLVSIFILGAVTVYAKPDLKKQRDALNKQSDIVFEQARRISCVIIADAIKQCFAGKDCTEVAAEEEVYNIKYGTSAIQGCSTNPPVIQ